MFVLPELLGPQISIRKTSAGMQGWPCLYLLLEEPWSKFTNFIFFCLIDINAGKNVNKKLATIG